MNDLAPPDADPQGDVTTLLRAWQSGDEQAGDRLAEQIYPKLREIARCRLARANDLSLQVTELVNEAFIKLTGYNRLRWKNRQQLLALVARFMRQILLDYARHKHRAKRGGRQIRVPLEVIEGPVAARVEVDLLILDDALRRLAEVNEMAARVVELRYFGGLTLEEAASVLGVGRTTIVLKWRFARAWLRADLRSTDTSQAASRARK